MTFPLKVVLVCVILIALVFIAVLAEMWKLSRLTSTPIEDLYDYGLKLSDSSSVRKAKISIRFYDGVAKALVLILTASLVLWCFWEYL